MIIAELIDCQKNYLDRKFNLQLMTGDKLLIYGINGSGKTTLIKLLTGYIKPDQGIRKSSSKSVGYLEENFALPEEMKVKDYLKTMKKIKHGTFDDELNNIFNIPCEKRIKELSKGNRQKVAITSLFLANHDYYVLDEPLNGLDVSTTELFVNYLKKANKTLVIISHQKEQFEELATKVLKL